MARNHKCLIACLPDDVEVVMLELDRHRGFTRIRERYGDHYHLIKAMYDDWNMTPTEITQHFQEVLINYHCPKILQIDIDFEYSRYLVEREKIVEKPHIRTTHA